MINASRSGFTSVSRRNAETVCTLSKRTILLSVWIPHDLRGRGGWSYLEVFDHLTRKITQCN